jgi:cobalt/nickel transport system permease protein
MHMADALISPAVGGTMWIVSAGLLAYCARKLKQTVQDNLVPMMGVLGAFIFAAQMINFSIPGTGSSGHLGGGLILSVLLGPCAAFLVIASVLTVQALFFADGGLLALGCNIFNLGFYPAFIAYPLIYRVITRDNRNTLRVWLAALAAAVVGLQLGAFSVVLEIKVSGISELPFGIFVLLMLPIHLAIGVVEGLATAAVVSFVAHARPEAVAAVQGRDASSPRRSLWRSLGPRHPICGRLGEPSLPFKIPVYPAGLLIAALVIGGALSWFASTHPDGLEWSITKVTGKEEISGASDVVHQKLAAVQEKTAVLPDYGFKSRWYGEDAVALPSSESENQIGRARASGSAEPETWPAVTAGTSVSGIVGGLITLGLACLIGFALKARSRKV